MAHPAEAAFATLRDLVYATDLDPDTHFEILHAAIVWSSIRELEALKLMAPASLPFLSPPDGDRLL